MNEVIPALGCLGLLLFGLPIWAILEARRARREAAQLRATVAELSGRVTVLARRVSPGEPETPSAAATTASAPPSPSVQTTAPSPGVSRPPAAPPMPVPSGASSSAPPPGGATPSLPPAPAAPTPPASVREVPVGPQPPQPPPAPPAAPRKPLDWENLISVRAFAWLGGAALFLAMGLFLQYSIQHNLISPAARVAIGLLVGAVALAGGDWLRSKADWAGQATAGAGVAILYASLFAAHSRYALLGATATFAGMAFVTVVAGLLAARRGTFVVAVLGLIGGFLTPYLLATNEDRPVALFAYTLLLDVGAIAVSRSRRWLALRYLSLLGSVILFVGWAAAHLDAGKAPYALLAAAALAALFAVLGGTSREGKEGKEGIEEKAEHREEAQAIPLLATAGPLAAAMWMSSVEALAVSPAFLTGYLLILAAGAFFVSRGAGFPPLVPIAAAFSVVTLAARISAGLVTDRTGTLLLFATVPAAYLAIALVRREEGRAERVAAAISLAGGFLVFARFLELSPKEPVLPLWIFAAAHAVGLLAIGTRLASGAWVAGAQAFLFVCLLVLTTAFSPARLSEFLPLVLGPAVAFWALPFLSARWRGDRYAWLSSAAAPILHFPVLYVLARPAWGTDVLGAAAIVFAVAALLALKRSMVILESPADRRFTTAVFGGVTLAFVTAAIPILLDKEWITVAWALEAAALAWLWRRVPQEGLVQVSTALAAASFLRLVANPLLWHYHQRSGTRIFNWYLYTFGIPAGAFLAAAVLVRTNRWAEQSRVPAILRAAAGVLLFILLNVEIADFYSTGGELRFRLSGGGLGEDVTYSLAWGAFAMILLALGITRGSRAMRAASLGVLLLTIGKVFLHDLWDLGALYRVGSILGLAVALLAVSFLTQRFVLAKERP